MKSPLIGIAAQAMRGSKADRRYLPALLRYYQEAVLDAGGVPLIIPFGIPSTNLRKLFNCIDALLLPGGEDVDPSRYGEKEHSRLGTVNLERDESEITLIRLCIKANKPLLAICRGMQVLNVACGGSLYQDLRSQYRTSIRHNNFKVPDDWSLLAHSITLERDSLLFKTLKKEKLKVNSLHHQAIKKLGGGLTVSAKSPDGLIEAVENTASDFCIGVQCHPETLVRSSQHAHWRRLFQEFVRAAR